MFCLIAKPFVAGVNQKALSQNRAPAFLRLTIWNFAAMK
jgi:hypothetical protein